MNISPVFNLDGFVRRRDKAPKLVLDVIFGDDHVSESRSRGVIVINHSVSRTRRGMCFEPELAELKVPSLETRQTVFLTLVKTEIPSSTRQASEAKPLVLRDGS